MTSLKKLLEPLFNVEYADVLGIPFDFTAKPVPVKPIPPRETIQVRAVRPDRDPLEIQFPRVSGYRVELVFVNRKQTHFIIENGPTLGYRLDL